MPGIKKPRVMALSDADLGRAFRQWFEAQRFSRHGAWEPNEVAAIRSAMKDIDLFARDTLGMFE